MIPIVGSLLPIVGSMLPGRPGAIARWLGWRRLVVDLLVVVAWVGIVTVGFRFTDWSVWSYVLVALGGVLAYSLAGIWYDRRRSR